MERFHEINHIAETLMTSDFLNKGEECQRR